MKKSKNDKEIFVLFKTNPFLLFKTNLQNVTAKFILLNK